MSPPVHLLHICLCVFKVLLVVLAHQFYVALVGTAPVTESVSVTRIVWNRVTAVLTIVQPVDNVSEDKHRDQKYTHLHLTTNVPAASRDCSKSYSITSAINIITASLSQHPPFHQHFLPSLLSQLQVCHHLRAISKIHIYTFTLFVLLLKKVSNHQMFKLLQFAR